jgi:hypothetical protein
MNYFYMVFCFLFFVSGCIPQNIQPDEADGSSLGATSPYSLEPYFAGNLPERKDVFNVVTVTGAGEIPLLNGSGRNVALYSAAGSMLDGWSIIESEAGLSKQVSVSWNESEDLKSVLSRADARKKNISFEIGLHTKTISIAELPNMEMYASCQRRVIDDKKTGKKGIEAAKIYNLKSSMTLEQNLLKWIDGTRVNLDWKFPDDLTIGSSLNFCGTLKESVKSLGEALHNSRFPVDLLFNKSPEGSTIIVKSAQ